jgi:filamentous hemagglutinin
VNPADVNPADFNPVNGAPSITAAQTGISAPSGTLALNAGGTASSVPAIGLGGELDFSAANISQSGAVIVPSGVVTLSAQNVVLSPTATINTAGVNVAIVDQSVGSEGGQINVSAGSNLTLAQGATLNVSGAGSAPAGSIQLTAGGIADVGANLQGEPGSAAEAGLFTLDANSLVQGFTALDNALQAGGFNQQVNVRVRTGDLDLAAGTQLVANQVTLTADTGTVDIAGTVSAPDADVRGSIGLYGGQGVVLESGSLLAANTAGTSGLGGDIELGTSSGSIALDAGSTVSAAGSAGAGTLLIRAPLVGGTTGIAIAGSNLSDLAQILIEPVITEVAATSGSTLNTANYNRIAADVTAQMNAAAPSLAAALNPNGVLPLQVRAAVDVVQNGNLTVSTGPTFSTSSWRFNGEPVDLTIRATGDLTLAGTLSDGFTTSGTGAKQVTVLSTTPDYDSASFRLVAGADTNSPNPLAVVDGSAATLQLGSGNTAGVVRTGTGDIDLVASGNITFNGTGSSPHAEVYTAGQPGVAAVAVKNSTSVFNFPTEGGNVVVSAGGDIVGAAIGLGPAGTVSGPSPTSWLIRQGNGTTAAQWGVDLTQYSLYGWNVGSLGGGDIRVSSGGDISNLSAAAADSYAATSTGSAIPFLSGGLDVRADGDIGSGEFYIADGSSMLNAGGAFSAVRPDSEGFAGSLIALDNAQVFVEARLGAVLDGIVNPTVMSQAATAQGLSGSFFTYTANSELTVQSSTGAVTLGNDSTHLSTLLGQAANGVGGTNQLYPATLIAEALSGDLTVSPATLFPSSNGQLELLAAQDINYSGGSSSYLAMSDAFAGSIATAQSPGGTTIIQQLTDDFQSAAHAGDPNPAMVVAGGNINSLGLSVPKATEILAGEDITNLDFHGQNLNPTDLTLIAAGRDFVDTLDGTGEGAQVQVGGPGSVDVLAGRNVNLGFSFGIVTVGDLVNPNLANSNGANLTIMAGLGQAPDYQSFLQNVVAPSTTYQTELVTYVAGLSGQSGLSYSDAAAQFNDLNAGQQRAFLNQVFFNQLLTSGEDDNTIPGAGFALGYAAIDTLFPGSRTAVATGPSPYSGNLTLDFSQIYTESGGNISLLVPGGEIDVGLANAPPSVPQKQPSQLGIVAEGPGDVDIYSKGDVNVNASRIFTLGGGNILIWSDEGNIDAGQGAKSSVSAPAPTVSVNAAGQVSLNFEGAVAGSGIRTIQVTPEVPPGNVDLIAPVGTVNAGDAGIGASGNINIAAEHVLGLDNIQFGGQATGVPAQVSDIGVSLSGASSVASGATNSATSSADEQAKQAQSAMTPLSQAAISWLDVFVTGLGEENCRPDDVDCLKRQKTN